MPTPQPEHPERAVPRDADPDREEAPREDLVPLEEAQKHEQTGGDAAAVDEHGEGSAEGGTA
ncbi:hypothetical protein SK069_01795 [Patulibacter brassicae]|jgi:hypothetical protein|uniref:Nucleotide exchange factor GrpE n=1 Tax=Patulibacter brassicae TaxID=1705717 RepID=A0ABU4VEU4_9ACTN|nr:hypothetical protein [Patulibacter brassicae]MDX8150313.1 hypothetical protein [Patulibacter brassicae]